MQLGCCILVVGGALCSGSVAIGMVCITMQRRVLPYTDRHGQFLAGRVIAGIGAGILAVVVPMYQGEVSTAETRGAMMCVTGIMYAFGYTAAGWMGFACSFFPANSHSATFAWRFPLALQCLPPLVVLAGSNFIPYSPRWLLGKDRREEAFAIVQRLHATPDDPDHIAARQEFYLMEKQFELDKQFKVRPLEIFRGKANLRRTLMAFLLMWGDQFLGKSLQPRANTADTDHQQASMS